MMARRVSDPAIVAASERSTGTGKNRVSSRVATKTGSRDSTGRDVIVARDVMLGGDAIDRRYATRQRQLMATSVYNA